MYIHLTCTSLSLIITVLLMMTTMPPIPTISLYVPLPAQSSKHSQCESPASLTLTLTLALTLTLGTTATHFSQHPITAVPGPARCLSRSTKNAHVEGAPGADMPSYRRLWAGYKGKTSMRACFSWPVCVRACCGSSPSLLVFAFHPQRLLLPSVC